MRSMSPLPKRPITGSISVISGDAIGQTLKYVQYNGNEILKKVRDELEKGVASQKIIH